VGSCNFFVKATVLYNIKVMTDGSVSSTGYLYKIEHGKRQTFGT